MAYQTRRRRYFRAVAGAAGLDDPDIISDQWMLLTEGATITALVEGDRAAAHKARARHLGAPAGGPAAGPDDGGLGGSPD